MKSYEASWSWADCSNLSLSAAGSNSQHTTRLEKCQKLRFPVAGHQTWFLSDCFEVLGSSTLSLSGKLLIFSTDLVAHLLKLVSYSKRTSSIRVSLGCGQTKQGFQIEPCLSLLREGNGLKLVVRSSWADSWTVCCHGLRIWTVIGSRVCSYCCGHRYTTSLAARFSSESGISLLWYTTTCSSIAQGSSSAADHFSWRSSDHSMAKVHSWYRMFVVCSSAW